MSLMQQAYDTYNYAEKKYAGVYFADKKEPLAPIGHWITNAAIEITINGDGKFLAASSVGAENEKTLFPVTENSTSRTSTSAAEHPHPLCDQLQFFMHEDLIRYPHYIEQLEMWAESDYSHPVIRAVLAYVKAGTIRKDLADSALLKTNEDGSIKNNKDFVRWIVNGIGDESGPCWSNRNLHKAFTAWYSTLQSSTEDYCMITGEVSSPAKQHTKGVISHYGNAKIISANDNNGFTYRGRFLNDKEALNVSYNTSQKAHNALRWVIANEGSCFGDRCFVCWNPQGRKLPEATGIMARRSGISEYSYTPSAYKQHMQEIITGWKSELPQDAKAVIAAFDAATTGRLSVNYYSEMPAADFIERLGYWDETCCWYHDNFGIQSPTLYKIADYAFGTLQSNKFVADNNVKKNILIQLLACRLEKAKMPLSIERALVLHAGNMQIVPDDEKSKYLRRDLLFTTCAVIRKYYIDHFKEEWNMALEPENKDRSYQFGRLMAILEKAEKDTYDSDDKRETNIIRRQLAFVERPYSTTVSVLEQIKTAYYPQLSVASRKYYEMQIENIMEILSKDPVSLNRPLKDTYLLGYYLQKKNFYTSKKENMEE